MFDNPFFTYAGYNNRTGVEPTIISVANTTNSSAEVKLFNAQENLTADNQNLPDGVLVNQDSIYEMASPEVFSCFEPLGGFRAGTTFSITLSSSPAAIRYFVSNADYFTSASKIISGGYSGFINDSLYKIDARNQEFLPLNVTGEEGFLGSGSYRFVFGVPNFERLGTRDIVTMNVRNTTTYPCSDSKTLIQTQTGFNTGENPNAATYKEILQASNFAPLGVESILIQSPKMPELAKNPIFVSQRDANGNKNEQQVRLLRTPYLRQNQRILSNLKKIDGATEVRFDIPRNTTADLYIYEKNRLVG